MKRNCRSEVLFDMDDLIILKTIRKTKRTMKSESIYGGTYDKDFVTMDDLKKELNLSHKSILVHLKRMEKMKFISRRRYGKGNKRVAIFMGSSGLHLFYYFSDVLKQYI